MDLHQINLIAVTVTSVAAALGALYGGYRLGWPWLKKRWQGRMKVQLLSALDRIERTCVEAADDRAKMTTMVGGLAKEFHLFRAQVAAVIAADPETATFEASPQGLLTEASKAYLRWTGRSFADLERWGWINCVHPDDRINVRAEWDAAVRDQRQSVMRYKLIGADGNDFKVLVTTTPIPDGAAVCEKFVGVIHRQPEA